MKKITLIATLVMLAYASYAQYDDIKNSLLIGSKYKDARADFDKKMANAKFASKPEAYILKATIYSYLANDSATQATPEGATLQKEAEAAFEQYKKMDPTMELVKDPVYRNAPINIYSGLFNAGYKDYQDKKWEPAFEKFQKVVEYSDLLGKEKLLNSPLDTNAIILAAYTAENSKKREEAAKYYSRLAEAGVRGSNYESVYHFLVTYNFEKKDMDAFEKYKKLGHDMYPNSDFFTYDKIDFAVGLEENFDSKVKALELQLATDPTNYKANLALAQLIYDTLHSDKDGAVKPANAADLDAKLVTALTKAQEAKPDDEIAFLIMGDHYINHSIDVDKDRETHVADMKKRTKPGTAASKEDIAKRDALDKAYSDAFDAARVPYEKAADIYSKKATLTGPQKQQYKKAAGYLGDIYTYKVQKAKGKPELAGLQAQEKKWNDLYSSIH